MILNRIRLAIWETCIRSYMPKNTRSNVFKKGNNFSSDFHAYSLKLMKAYHYNVDYSYLSR